MSARRAAGGRPAPLLSYPRTAAEAATCIDQLIVAVNSLTSPATENALFEAQRLLSTCGFPAGSQEAEAAFNLLSAEQHATVARLAKRLWTAQAAAITPGSRVSPGHVMWVMVLGGAHWEIGTPWDEAAARRLLSDPNPSNTELEAYGTRGALWKLSALLQQDVTTLQTKFLGQSRDEIVETQASSTNNTTGGTTILQYLGSGSNTPNIVHFVEGVNFAIVLESKANTSAYKDRSVVLIDGTRTGHGRVRQDDPKMIATISSCMIHNRSRDPQRAQAKRDIGHRLRDLCRKGRVGYLCVRSNTRRNEPPQVEHRKFFNRFLFQETENVQ